MGGLYLQSTPGPGAPSFGEVALDCTCVSFGLLLSMVVFAAIVLVLARRARAPSSADRTQLDVPREVVTTPMSAVTDGAPAPAPHDHAALATAQRRLEEGDLDGALATFGELAARSPAHGAEAHLGIGIAWRRKGEPARAISHLRHARSLGADARAVDLELEAAEHALARARPR